MRLRNDTSFNASRKTFDEAYSRADRRRCKIHTAKTAGVNTLGTAYIITANTIDHRK